MKISVVCPTFGREEHGPRVYEIFTAQTYADRELIVLDDSPSPSPFFLRLDDPRVRYHHTSQRTTVGAKRNWLAQEATGKILAHFDDDDYYAPTYLDRMVTALGDADLVKLSGFYLFSVTHGAFAYWDLNHAAELHFRLESSRPLDLLRTETMTPEARELWQLKNLLGYGFSCVYRKSLWERVRFADARHGEDFHFVESAMQAGATVRLPLDRDGVAIVLRHPHDSSIVYPQYLLPPHILRTLFGAEGHTFVEQAIARGAVLPGKFPG